MMFDAESFEERTGKLTIGGAELIIVLTPTGYYKIKADGPGADPALCEDRFTNLKEARKAIDLYQQENAPRLATKETMREGIAKRKAANKE